MHLGRSKADSLLPNQEAGRPRIQSEDNFPPRIFKLEMGSAGTELMWKTDSTVTKIVCDGDTISCTDKTKEKQNNTQCCDEDDVTHIMYGFRSEQNIWKSLDHHHLNTK